MSDKYETDGMIITSLDGGCMGIFSAVSLLNDKEKEIAELKAENERLKRALEEE